MLKISDYMERDNKLERDLYIEDFVVHYCNVKYVINQKRKELMKFSKIWILGCFTVLYISCGDDLPSEETIDSRISEQLMGLGGAEGVDFFILPESNEYDKIPQDPKNQISRAKVELGKLLFHETALASKGSFSETELTYSCASCHHAAAGFQANLPQGIGDGGMGFGVAGEARTFNPFCEEKDIDVQPIRTPSSLNSAFQQNMLWNGQFGGTGVNIGTEASWTEDTPKAVNHLGYEGVETQAVAGLGVHRFGLSISQDFIMNTEYRELFDVAFPEIQDVDRYEAEYAGLAIAAYERTTLANESPWQEYLKGQQDAMTQAQKEGAYIFLTNNCVDCHTGPALNSMEFHAFGMNNLFNGSYGSGGVAINVGDNVAEHRGRGGFTGNTQDDFKFKVPQLYNLKDSPFYGHGSSFSSLYDVVKYKINGIPQNADVPVSQLANQFRPITMNEEEITKLVDFLENALYDPNLDRYTPTSLPSGFCFPNNDALSRIDLGCL